jgi:hypothetical protein
MNDYPENWPPGVKLDDCTVSTTVVAAHGIVGVDGDGFIHDNYTNPNFRPMFKLSIHPSGAIPWFAISDGTLAWAWAVGTLWDKIMWPNTRHRLKELPAPLRTNGHTIPQKLVTAAISEFLEGRWQAIEQVS